MLRKKREKEKREKEKRVPPKENKEMIERATEECRERLARLQEIYAIDLLARYEEEHARGQEFLARERARMQAEVQGWVALEAVRRVQSRTPRPPSRSVSAPSWSPSVSPSVSASVSPSVSASMSPSVSASSCVAPSYAPINLLKSIKTFPRLRDRKLIKEE